MTAYFLQLLSPTFVRDELEKERERERERDELEKERERERELSHTHTQSFSNLSLCMSVSAVSARRKMRLARSCAVSSAFRLSSHSPPSRSQCSQLWTCE